MRRKISYNIEMILASVLLLAFIWLTFLLIGKVLPLLKNSPTGTLLILIAELVLAGIGYLVFKMLTRFIKGDNGEMDVKFILDRLEREGYYYLSDVVIGEKGNVDTVVVGPTGIWTIEVKNQSEKVIIHDKYLEKDLKQAYAEKMSVQNLLSQLGINTIVSSALVFANKRTRMNFGMRPIEGVYVIGKKWLPELLTRHSTGYLSPEQCLQIKESLKPYSSKLN